MKQGCGKDNAVATNAHLAGDVLGNVGLEVLCQDTNIAGQGGNTQGDIAQHAEESDGSLPVGNLNLDRNGTRDVLAVDAIPLDAVAETTKIESVRLTDIKGRKAVTLRGDVLGIVELAEMLGLPPAKELPEMLSVVVIHDNERRLGLVVDQLLERQEIVIKPLGAYLGDLQGISGATIMGDGSVILILDPHEIYMLSTSKSMTSNLDAQIKNQQAAAVAATQNVKIAS